MDDDDDDDADGTEIDEWEREGGDSSYESAKDDDC